MTAGSQIGAGCPYESGRMPWGAGLLRHPGGLVLTSRAIGIARLESGARVLDLGSGSGETVAFLRNRGIHAIGVDPAVAVSETCAPADGDPLCVQASAEDLPFADQSVDGVLAECSLSVMQDMAKALEECARVLRPGGHLMISDLYARNPEGISAVRALKGSCVAGMIVQSEIESLLDECGFAIDCFEDHSGALREAMAQFIFDNDSIEELWQNNASGSQAHVISRAMAQLRPGYFLMVATRRADPRVSSANFAVKAAAIDCVKGIS